MGTFDPDAFLNTETSEAMETRFTPVEAGEYVASVDSIKVREAKSSHILDVNWNILDDALRAKMNMEKVTVRQSVFLDLEPDGRLSLGPNKNVQLGRLRNGLGQNQPGKPWSFRMLQGAGPVKISITQRPDPDKKDEATGLPIIYNDVAKISPMA